MRTPDFWKRDGMTSRSLLPLSLLYGAAASLRRDADPYRCLVPVLCIGNVTAGGSGKTPAALSLMEAAQRLGINAHFLSRGYGGSLSGPVLVDASHNFHDVGDEALLLARLAPAWIARDRVAGATSAAAAGAQLIIMDDGFQNPHIIKDLSILVIDGGFGFGNGRLLPAGPLREPVKAAIARAGAVIVINPVTPFMEGATSNARIVPALHELNGKPVVAFAGLGRPAKFRETLESEGVQITEFHAFGDHHVYKPRELDRLLAASGKHNAILVTTEKDFVRLPTGFAPCVATLPITLEFEDPTLPETLIRRVMAR